MIYGTAEKMTRDISPKPASDISRSCRLFVRAILGVCLLLWGCSSGGESGSLTPQPAANTVLEQQAIANLLTLYQNAVRQEDIDRLQELLVIESGAVQSRGQARQNVPDVGLAASAFRDAMSEAFRTLAFTNLQILETSIEIAADSRRVTFLEVESVIDSQVLEQQTRVFRTSWQLQQTTSNGIQTVRIAVVERTGPLALVRMRGRVLASQPTRVEVITEVEATAVDLTIPESETIIALVHEDGRFHGLLTPPVVLPPLPLQVRVRTGDGSELRFAHVYQVRLPDDGVVDRLELDDVAAGRFFAVTLGADADVWFGGESTGRLGQLVQLDLETATVLQSRQLVATTEENALGRIEDLVVDDRGRLHALFLVSPPDNPAGIISNGVVVFDPVQVDCQSQTVNIFDPDYPLLVQDVSTGDLNASPSARLLAAGGGDVWLFGSDGGVARVADSFEDCSATAVTVSYNPVFRRPLDGNEPGLLTNSVPALVAGRDGALWFGTALGVLRLRDGLFTPVPFERELSLQGDPATLETFFRAVAEAIFNARPLITVAIGEVSFVDTFGAALVKEDLSFSAVEDAAGQIWVGTLGGGVRQLDTRVEPPVDLVHVTRQDGLASNNVLALTTAPDRAVWAATDEGLSRLQVSGDTVTLTTFSALDGLVLPVRDVAVDHHGVVWVATDGGMFRLLPSGGEVRGMVLETEDRPVVGADIILFERRSQDNEVSLIATPFRAITDSNGQFVLANLPPGAYQLQVDSLLAVGGPFPSLERDFVATGGEQTLGAFMLGERQLRAVAGDLQTGVVGTQLSLPLVVEATDATGAPLAGIEVSFNITSGNGALSVTTATTAADGRAVTMLRLGTIAGSNLVEARAAMFTPVVFTATGQADQASGRLVQVSGNNQNGPPGTILPAPLVVRLEDQFSNPLRDMAIAAVISTMSRGAGVLVPLPAGALCSDQANDGTAEAMVMTNTQGEAAFCLRLGMSDEGDNDVLVEASVPALPEVAPVPFLAIVGEVDTPDIPLDLAVQGNRLLVADRRSGLQVIDVSEPTAPQLFSTIDVDGTEVRLALAGDRAYVGTNFPLRLYILDRTQLASDQEPLGRIQFPETLQRHGMTGIAIAGDVAYLVTDARTANAGTLQVADVSQPGGCFFIAEGTDLPGRPRGIAIANGFAYVPAGEAGVLLFDVSNPMQPLPLTPLSGNFFSDIAIANSMAYVVETRQGRQFFTALDLSNPVVPQRRGAIEISMTTQVAEVAATIAVDERFAYLVQFAAGLAVIDIQMPDNPRLLGMVDTPSQALNLAVAGDFLFVSDQIFGIQVIPRPTEDTVFAPPPQGPPGEPPNLLPVGTTTLVVDAAAVREQGNGTAQTPYRSITEVLLALRLALQMGDISATDSVTVLIRPGTYTPLTTQEIFPLDLSSLPSITVRSLDPDNPEIVQTTVLDAGFSGDVFFLSADPQPTDRQVNIAGLTLIHGAHGVFMRGSAQLTLRQNRLMENIFAGLSMGGNTTMGNLIDGNTVERNGQEGLGLFQTALTRTANNTVRNNGEVGVFLGIDTVADITDNLIVGNGDDGIRIHDRSVATVTGNTIGMNGSFGASAGGCRAIGDGIALATDSQAEILTNTIDGNRRDGILIQTNSTATITGNIIINQERRGLSIDQAAPDTALVIADNTLENNGLENCSQNNGEVDCQQPAPFIRTLSDGIFVSDTTAELTITNNSIQRNHDNGIELVDTPQATLIGNRLTAPPPEEFSRHGIEIGGSTSYVVVRDNNTIMGYRQDGIFVGLGVTAEIIANTISENAGNGINFSNAAEGSRAMANAVSRNGMRGVRVAFVTGLELVANTITDNGEQGVVLTGAATNLRDNAISHNVRAGLLIEAGSAATLMRNTVEGNGDDGVQIVDENTIVTIDGGMIIENSRRGIFLSRRSMASIGLSAEVLTLARNGGAGIFVTDDGSCVILDTRRVIFDRNGEESVIIPCVP